MRFIMGLITGTGLVLMTTGVSGTPAGELPALLRQNAETLWQSLLQVTSRSLFELPVPASDPPGARSPDPDPVVALDGAGAAAGSLLDPLPLLDPPEATSNPGEAQVWVPFHSERSAAGFADRLTQELGHPFEVAREAPGRYTIRFRYHDDEERQELLARIAQVTGTPL
jgi:hypothetical protein